MESIGEIVETRFQSVAVRLSEPFLTERKLDNHSVWTNAKNWHLGFYFGKEDTRLWVPKMRRQGKEDPNQRVINFAHPLGRKAFKILMLGYTVAALGAATLLAYAFGIRW